MQPTSVTSHSPHNAPPSNPSASEPKIPDIISWLAYLDQHEQWNKDGIVFSQFGPVLQKMDFVHISQLSLDFIKLLELQDLLGINLGTAISLMQYARDDLEVVKLIFGMDDLGVHAHVTLTGLTIARCFHDKEGQDIHLFIDSTFHFTQAGSKVSALLGHIPSAVGYQLALSMDMGSRQEYITTTKKGLTALVQAIYVPANDLMDPSPATTFVHSDATTAPSHSIAELGIYPAVNPLDPKSHMLDPYYKSLQNIITILGMDKFLGEDKLTPFQVAQVFTGYEGKLVQFKDTVQSFENSSSGTHDNLLRLLPTWLIQLRAKAEQLAKEMCGSWLDT
ncbi:P-loop containing nucleoside triphosphate hydrolase protein [Pisolithus thermaeus]|nr:P-loop containing nucleoside triphosphate hydrolase protein [Pisolithus thermaeus]